MGSAMARNSRRGARDGVTWKRSRVEGDSKLNQTNICLDAGKGDKMESHSNIKISICPELGG